jgi:hypothetical protein
MERRRAPRRPVAVNEPLSNARLRTGGQLRILDASSWGALAETVERLLPGRHLDMHIVSAHGRVLVRSRVVRAHVAQLTADSVRYHAALAFERELDVHVEGYALPEVLVGLETDAGNRYPATALRGDIEFADLPSA